MDNSLGGCRRAGLLFLLPLSSQLFAVEGGQGATDLPKSGPGLLSPTSGLGVLRRDVQRATLSVAAVGDIQVRSMQALGIALADAVWIAATAGGLRQPALDGIRWPGGVVEGAALAYSSFNIKIRRSGFGVKGKLT